MKIKKFNENIISKEEDIFDDNYDFRSSPICTEFEDMGFNLDGKNFDYDRIIYQNYEEGLIPTNHGFAEFSKIKPRREDIELIKAYCFKIFIRDVDFILSDLQRTGDLFRRYDNNDIKFLKSLEQVKIWVESLGHSLFITSPSDYFRHDVFILYKFIVLEGKIEDRK